MLSAVILVYYMYSTPCKAHHRDSEIQGEWGVRRKSGSRPTAAHFMYSEVPPWGKDIKQPRLGTRVLQGRFELRNGVT